jgi:hypothetical protein
VVAQRLDSFQVGGPETLDELAVDLGEHLARLVVTTLKFGIRLRVCHLGRGRASPWDVPFDLAQQLPAEGFAFDADFEIGSWSLYAAKELAPELWDDPGGETLHRSTQIALRQTAEIHVYPEMGHTVLLLHE